MSDKKPLIVRGDSTLLVDNTLIDEETLEQVRLIAQLEEEASPVSTFRITRESICRTLSTGFSLKSLLDFLNDKSKHKIPQNVDAELREYASRFGDVNVVLEGEDVLLRTSKTEVIKLLEKNYGDRFIHRNSEDSHGLYINPLRISAISDFLAKHGFPVHDPQEISRRNWQTVEIASTDYNLPYNVLRRMEVVFAGKGEFVDVGKSLEEKVCAFETSTRQQVLKFRDFLHQDYFELLNQRYVNGDSKLQRANKINRQHHLNALSALEFVSSENFVANSGGEDLFIYVVNRYKEFFEVEDVPSTECDKIIVPLVNKLSEKVGVYYIRVGDFLEEYVLPPSALNIMQSVSILELESTGSFVVCKGTPQLVVRVFEEKVRARLTECKRLLSKTQDEIAKERYFSKGSYHQKRRKLMEINGSQYQKTHNDLIGLLEFVEKVDYVADYKKRGKGMGILTFLVREYKDYGFNSETFLNLARHAGWDYQSSRDALRKIGLVGLRLDHFPAIWTEYHANGTFILVSDKTTSRALKDLGQKYLHQERDKVDHD